MSLFGSHLSKKKADPNPIRDALFGDMPVDAWPIGGDPGDKAPWGAFVAARAELKQGNQSGAIDLWRSILAQPDLESRHYVQAWSFLRERGQRPSPDIATQVLGVVVEVALDEGLDLLAAYSDRSARYYNYSGGGVVWERPDASLDSPIDRLLEASRKVVEQIGPWDRERPGPPPVGKARLSFLTPSGLHFGQGSMDVLSHDPLGTDVLNRSIALMRALIAKKG